MEERYIVIKEMEISFRIYIFCFFVLIISTFISLFFTNIKYLDIVLCICPIILFFLKESKNLRVNICFVFILFWDLINIFHMVSCTNQYYLKVLLFQNIVFLFVYFASLCRCSKEEFDYTYTVIKRYTILLSLLQIIFGISGRKYGISFVLFGLSYFILEEKGKPKYLQLILMMIAFWIGRNRSSILMILLCLFLSKHLKKIKRNIILYKFSYVCVCVIVCLIPIGYLWLFYSPYATYLNDLSQSIFSKNLFSGRQVLWVEIFSWFDEYNMFWGIGGEFVGGEYAAELEVSTHNVYLFLLGQGGILSLSLFFFFFYKIYMKFYEFIEDGKVLSCSAYLLALMIRSSFDLMLIANRFVDSMYSWLSLALVISYCNYLSDKERSMNRS